MCVFLFSGLGFVVEDVQVTVADLQEVNMAGDDLTVEVECKSTPAIISDVVAGEKHGYFNCGGNGVVDEHESLERFMSFFGFDGEVGRTNAAVRVAWFSFRVIGGASSVGNFDERCSVDWKSLCGKSCLTVVR